jgi:hypothetical protein
MYVMDQGTLTEGDGSVQVDYLIKLACIGTILKIKNIFYFNQSTMRKNFYLNQT